jgi:hypothetical protein
MLGTRRRVLYFKEGERTELFYLPDVLTNVFPRTLGVLMRA